MHYPLDFSIKRLIFSDLRKPEEPHHQPGGVLHGPEQQHLRLARHQLHQMRGLRQLLQHAGTVNIKQLSSLQMV